MLARLLCAALVLPLAAHAADYGVSNNPYATVNWATTIHCQAQHHDHAYNSSRITDLSNAGYCAATAMHYQGGFTPTAYATWVSQGSPNPEMGVAIGWAEPKRWPPTDHGFPALPLNSLRLYLPGAEERGAFASGTNSEHFFSLGLTTYMETVGCDACGNSGGAVRNHNPLGLAAGERWATNQEFIDKATTLGSMVTLNHPAGSPSSKDSLDPFPRAVEIYNNYHAMNDEGVGGTCGTSYIAGFQALWDHVLEAKSARIWGVAVNDWVSAWTALGTPSVACWPTVTTQNRDRGKLDVLVSTYDLSSYLDAFDRGAFFAVVEDNAVKSAYPEVTEIRVYTSQILIATSAGTETITWIGNGSVQGTGATISLRGLPAGLKYLRAEIDDGAGRVVYTQPFELTPTPRNLKSGAARIGGGRL